MQLAKIGTPGAILVRVASGRYRLIVNRRKEDRRKEDRRFKFPRDKRSLFGNRRQA